MEYSLEQQRENRKKLVAALRSGQYKQGRLKLHNHINNTWCCLGVACHVAGLEPEKDGKREYSSFGTTREVNLLPPEAIEAFGFSGMFGEFAINDYTDTLMVLNDGDNLTFDQIADIIEYEPEGLFVG